MNRFNLLVIASLGSLLFLPSADAFIQSYHPTSVLVSSTLSSTEIRQLAQAITVRVLSIHQGGSGILIKKQGQTYTILTNAHVVNFKGAHRIQTPNGKTYSAIVISRGDSLKGNDLALLQFKAKENYRVVPLAITANSSENQEVSAAGFPFDSKELVVSRGKISLLSPQPFVGGYQIGYTNEVQQGMSGGPLLNLEGKLIGVNGLLNRAILNDAYVYQNGSRPSTEQLQHFKQLSFAVPIQTLAQIAPHQASILTKGQNQQQASQQPVTNNIVDKVNNIAEKITVRIDSKNHGNGSGVIIAHTGQTYYVVTALHVVKCSDSYKIVTADGQQYALQQENIINPEGADVALLKFTSNKTYSVATIAKYNLFNLSKNNWVFLSGFPKNANGKRKFTAGLLWGKEKVFTRQYINNYLKFVIDKKYGISYTNLTLPGMSGGPVLDSNGQVVGINAGVDRDDSKIVNLGLGYGVPSSSIVSVATKSGLKPELLTVVTTAPEKLTEVEIKSIQNHSLFVVRKQLQNASDWLNYGNQLWRLDKYSEAIVALQQAIKLKPEDFQAARIHFAMGIVFYSQNKNQQALVPFKEAIKLNPENSDEIWRYEAENLQHLKKYSDALIAIKEAIKLNEKDVNLYVKKGTIMNELKYYKEAIAAYNQAIDVYKENGIEPQPPLSFVYSLRGIPRLNLKDYQGALADENLAIKLDPDFSLAYGIRGIIHQKLKDYPAALADLNQEVHLQPDDAITYINRGILYKQLKKDREALEDLNRSVELEPNPLTYTSRGAIFFLLKDYPAALKDFNEVIQRTSDFAEAYRQRGILFYNLQDYTAALADCNQAIKLEPDNAYSYSCRGNIYLGLHEFKQALLDYNQAIKLESDSAAVYASRGNLLREMKNNPGSLEDFNQAIKLDPNFTGYYQLRSIVRFDLKDQKGAMVDLEQAIKLAPDNAFSYSTRGEFRSKLKDYTGALADYDKVIILEPNNAIVYSARADVHSQLKDYTGAITDYTQVIKLLPNNPQGYFLRGVVHHKLRDYTAALSDYNQTIAKDDKFWSAYANIGYIKYEKGDVQGAIAQWQQSIKINSNTVEPQMAMAVALHAQGQQQLGLNMAKAALRLDKSWADVVFLKQNLWGDRLVADAQKLLSHPSLQTVRSH